MRMLRKAVNAVLALAEAMAVWTAADLQGVMEYARSGTIPEHRHRGCGEGIALDLEPDLDLAMALACVQRGRANAKLTHEVVRRAIDKPPEAFGFVDDAQSCRVCGRGDLRAC